MTTKNPVSLGHTNNVNMEQPQKSYRLGNFQVREYEEMASTNTFAASLRDNEFDDRTVILTWNQTQGRGQVGNHWESAPYQNIAMTLLLKPKQLGASRQFAMSMVIALGCYDFLSHHLKQVSVKWPNDIYVGNDKIAGILIEHKITGCYVGNSINGIGLNVNQEAFLSDAPNPISMRQILGHELPLQQMLEELLECLDLRYAAIDDYEALEKDFLSHLYRREGVYNWKDEHGEFRASIAGIDEYGQLILTDTDGRQRLYAFKEVVYLP